MKAFRIFRECPECGHEEETVLYDADPKEVFAKCRECGTTMTNVQYNLITDQNGEKTEETIAETEI